jgi:hypothetical protein
LYCFWHRFGLLKSFRPPCVPLMCSTVTCKAFYLVWLRCFPGCVCWCLLWVLPSHVLPSGVSYFVVLPRPLTGAPVAVVASPCPYSGRFQSCLISVPVWSRAVFRFPASPVSFPCRLIALPYALLTYCPYLRAVSLNIYPTYSVSPSDFCYAVSRLSSLSRYRESRPGPADWFVRSFHLVPSICVCLALAHLGPRSCLQ